MAADDYGTVDLPDPALLDVERRAEQTEHDMHRLRLQMIFLFAFLVVALVLAALRAQFNADRIELDRWQSCQERVVAVVAYNNHLPSNSQQFPVPICGQDPRTD